MDKIIQALLLTIAASFLFTFSSCKKVGREVLEETTEEFGEESGENLLKYSPKKAIRELSEEAIEKDAKVAIKTLCESSELFNILWKKQSSQVQEVVTEALEKQPRIINSLYEDPSLIDKYVSRYSDDALKKPSFFNYFVECIRQAKSKFGFSQLDKIDFISGEEVVKIVRKKDRKILGYLEDGIMRIQLPDAAEDIFRHELISEALIPGITYKVLALDGKLKYVLRTDQLGRIIEIEGKNIGRTQLLSNVLHITGKNIDLPIYVKSGKPKGWDAKVKIFYSEKKEIPQTAKIELRNEGSLEAAELVSNSVKHLHRGVSDIVKIAEAKGLSKEQVAKLLKEVEKKPGLAELIRENPDNIQRWLNTRNHVNKSLVAKTEKGRYVPNGKTYAGNTYYLNPNLNDELAARLRDPARGGEGFVQLKSGKKLSYEDLVEFDRKYPNGIPFSKEGFPDFSKVAYKKNSQPVELDLTHFDPNLGRQADINKANKIFRAKYGHEVPKGYTWHHIENSRKLVLVPTDFHQLVDHAGGIAAKKNKVASSQLKEIEKMEAINLTKTTDKILNLLLIPLEVLSIIE